MEQQIQANAEIVRTVAREQMNVQIDYDKQGVHWLDGYIDRQRLHATEDTKSKLPNTLGSYLGECIRRTYGGKWIQDGEYGWGVQVNDKVTVFPFTKVQKQLANADGDSVLGLFTALQPLMKAPPTPARSSSRLRAQPKKPWWRFW